MDITTSLKWTKIGLGVGPTKTAKCTGAWPLKQSGQLPKSLYYLEKTPSVQALRAEFPGVEATPSDSCSLREHKTKH